MTSVQTNPMTDKQAKALAEMRRIREGVLVQRDNATNPIVGALARLTLNLYDRAIARADHKHGM